jgi:glycosyltransferase involved in cell wall biosynthesis
MLQGCDVQVIGLDTVSPDDAVKRIREGGFDLCHAFHAHRGGTVALKVQECTGLPYLVTLTGSDVYEALDDHRRQETLAALAGAARVVAFHDAIAGRLLARASALANKVTVIPQGVVLQDRRPSRPMGDGCTFLLPAGLRPVKNVLFPLEPLARLADRFPGLRLVLAGPELDPQYASRVLARLQEFGFARHMGAVAHEEMAALYRQADVVLNTSLFEGGMANSLLEGMASGLPVLASNVEGNRSLVTEGVTGLLYRDTGEFFVKAARLAAEPSLRTMLGQAARQRVTMHHAPDQEAAAYLGLYRESIDKRTMHR